MEAASEWSSGQTRHETEAGNRPHAPCIYAKGNDSDEVDVEKQQKSVGRETRHDDQNQESIDSDGRDDLEVYKPTNTNLSHDLEREKLQASGGEEAVGEKDDEKSKKDPNLVRLSHSFEPVL